MAAADLHPGEREIPLASISPPDLKVGEREIPIESAPKTIGKPAEKGMGQRLAELSIPPKSWGDVGEKIQTGLHVLPYAAAALGPEGLVAGAAVQGISGAVEEFGVQSIDRMQGKRQAYDWPAMGWNAGWNTIFAAGGGIASKSIEAVTGAGKLATQSALAARRIATGQPVSPAILRETAQVASDELKSKMMLDSLGQRLGMTEEESAKMIGAYDEGRQVGDAMFKTDRMVQGEFKKEYDGILGKHHKTIADGTTIKTSIDKSMEWVNETGNSGHVRPSVVASLGHIADQVSPQTAITDLPQAMAFLGKNKMPLPIKATAQDLIKLANDAQSQGASIGQLRGRLSELRDLERTSNLTETEQSIVSQTQRSITRTISDVVGKTDPDAVAKLAATDARYGVYKSNLRTFWKALKDKKSLSEVGDAIYDQMGKRPDSLRYVLQAADRAGRMDDMRLAFLNKMWRESQVPGKSGMGTAVDHADALKKFIANYGPGAKGKDILQMVLGKVPGVTDSIGQFTQRLEDMSVAQKALKAPEQMSRAKRFISSRFMYGIYAGALGGGMYSAFTRHPVEASLTTLGFLATIGGASAAMKNPALNRAWVEWISTNPAAPLWIARGMRLAAQATKAGIIPANQDNAENSAGNR